MSPPSSVEARRSSPLGRPFLSRATARRWRCSGQPSGKLLKIPSHHGDGEDQEIVTPAGACAHGQPRRISKKIQISHPEPVAVALAFSEKKPRQGKAPRRLFTSSLHFLPQLAGLPDPSSLQPHLLQGFNLPSSSIHPSHPPSSLAPNPHRTSALPRTRTLAEQPCPPGSSRSSSCCSSPRPRPPAAPRERRLLGGGWCRWPRRRGSWARWCWASTTRGGGLGEASSSARPAPAAAGTGTPASSRPAATPSTATSPTAPSGTAPSCPSPATASDATSDAAAAQLLLSPAGFIKLVRVRVKEWGSKEYV